MSNKKENIKLKQFFHELKFEIKKVTWPQKNSVITSTLVIIFIMFFFTLFVMSNDFIFGKVIFILKNNFLRTI
ncbi:preprotein translocase subunit SecE [bacterium]|nr:preprotein translocase subunit SecE [bacterium]MBT3581222.1 preprotein translocase subunit SecE [bacterium]MBT4552363.1 preprotein translocase subunit SecE [bacterium]MBT5988328.1 preprotein translocase subunit SecE [bacterium]